MSLDKIILVEIKDINISHENVRHHNPDIDLEELAASIEKHGLLQPVILAGTYGKPKYELISGQRRFLAHQKILKRLKIPAVFVGEMDKTQRVIMSLVENMERLELDYLDTANAITNLYKHFNNDERKVSKETKISLQKIREYILVEAQATPKMKALLKNNKVTSADVKRALRATQDDPKKAEELLDLMVTNQLTSHQKRRVVRYGQEDIKASAKTIINKAMAPHVEETLVISLPKEIRDALTIAIKQLAVDPEELATKVLYDWLNAQGFVAKKAH